MPKVSIIVPVYKVPEQYLRKCIESCQNQTMQDVEILLVDDGSPDKCGKICDDYATEDNRIKVIHKQNGGLSAARNTGFETATGEKIMFVDGDDWIEPEMCEGMYQAAIKNNVQLVMCGMYRDYGHTRDKYVFYLKDGSTYRGDECKWLQEQLLHYNGNIAVAYSKLIDKEFLLRNGIEHDPVLRQGAEGLEFNLRMFEQLESAIFVDRPYYHYRYNPDSISSAPTEANNQFVIACFKKIRMLIDQSTNKEKLLPWFYNRFLYVIISTAISGYFNPSNEDSYETRVKKFKNYLNQDIVQDALATKNLNELSKQRKIVLIMIKHRMYWLINLLGAMRKRQKESK